MRTIADSKENYCLTELCRHQILDVGNANERTLMCGNWSKGRLSHYMPILHYPHQLVR